MGLWIIFKDDGGIVRHAVTTSMDQWIIFKDDGDIVRHAVTTSMDQWIIFKDDGGIVRHAVTTSMDHNETARNCLDIIALLKQHKVLYIISFK